MSALKTAVAATFRIGAPRYIVAGREVVGQSISFVHDELRGAKWKGLGSLSNFSDTCKDLGFAVEPGKCATRGTPARVVFDPSV